MTRNVTVGLDGSPESRGAAAWAAREALLREVPLHLVHAEEWPTTAAIPMVGPEVQQQWADKILADAADELRQRHPGLEITTRRLSEGPLPPCPSRRVRRRCWCSAPGVLAASWASSSAR